MSLHTLRRCLESMEVSLDLVPRWRGADLDRLLDEDHAGIQAAWKARLERWTWQVRVEVSFNRYGDRGRIDLLAWHPTQRIMVVGEVKTEIADVQALLGGMDTKVRVAANLARSLGLPPPRSVVPMLLVADGSTNRDRVKRFGALFSRFSGRGRVAMGWLRRPVGSASGLLVFTDLRVATGGSVTRPGRHRVRRSASDLSTTPAPGGRRSRSPGT